MPGLTPLEGVVYNYRVSRSSQSSETESFLATTTEGPLNQAGWKLVNNAYYHYVVEYIVKNSSGQIIKTLPLKNIKLERRSTVNAL